MVRIVQRSAAQHGFTLAEVLVAITILGLVSVALFWIISKGYSINRRETDQIVAQGIARSTLEKMTPEIRELNDAETGSYAIASATASSFIFYADTDNNGLTEKIRYFVDGTHLKRGSIVPAGSPLAYNAGAEQIKTVAKHLANSNVFTYYNAAYTGSQSALSTPVDVSKVRLVGITLSIDVLGGTQPDPFILTDRIQLRNLKDNL